MDKSNKKIPSISPINRENLVRTTSMDNNPLTPPPLLDLNKIRGVPIPKPEPTRSLKINIPNRNLNVSPIQQQKENLWLNEINSSKVKYNRHRNIYQELINKLKNYRYFRYLIANIDNEQKLHSQNIGIEIQGEKQMIENIRKMSMNERSDLLKRLSKIINGERLTLNYNFIDVRQPARALLADNELNALKPFLDEEDNQIRKIQQEKKNVYRNMIKNSIYQTMEHPEWNKEKVDEFMGELEKWNLFKSEGDVIKNKNKWILDPIISQKFIPDNDRLSPQKILEMLKEGMEGKWTQEIEEMNKAIPRQNKDDEFKSGQNLLATHDMLTQQPVLEGPKFGPVKIFGNKGLVKDEEASKAWGAQLGLDDGNKKMSSGSDLSTSSSSSSNKGFFGGKRKKKGGLFNWFIQRDSDTNNLYPVFSNKPKRKSIYGEPHPWRKFIVDPRDNDDFDEDRTDGFSISLPFFSSRGGKKTTRRKRKRKKRTRKNKTRRNKTRRKRKRKKRTRKRV